MAATSSSPEARTWTVLALLKEATDFLTRKEVSRSPRLDAELLLADTLGLDRVGLYTSFERLVKDQERTAFRELIRRRLAYEPVAYIRGKREFWGFEFEVTPDVLIPRPETEMLVEEALKIVRSEGSGVTLLDLCTGSGCIAVALAKGLPKDLPKGLKDARVYATDLSEAALEVAGRNAAKHGVADRVSLMHGDMWGALAGLNLEGAMDIIVSNPPYIPAGDITALEPNVRDFEPLSALDGGIDGLDFIRRIVDGAPAFLKPGGALLMETGCNQGQAVSTLMQEKGFTQVRVLKDYCGMDRVVTGIK